LALPKHREITVYGALSLGDAGPVERTTSIVGCCARAANVSSALTGIVVAARGADGRGYVLADLSGRFTPDGWARAAVAALDQYKADRIVAEGNQGGDLVRYTLSTIQTNLPISIVHASRSKQARAEPVAALYEQRRVTHLSAFPELDDQLVTWEPLSGDLHPTASMPWCGL
jgi:phage terminase large subunit-like protein